MRDCRNCFDLELYFSVADNGFEGERIGKRWEVIDAECETIAFCPSEAMAELVARALNELPKTNDIIIRCARHGGPIVAFEYPADVEEEARGRAGPQGKA